MQSIAPNLRLDEVSNVDSDSDTNFKELHIQGKEIVNQGLERPHKRRRIIDNEQLPTGQTVKNRLIGEVYGLLGSEAAPDLQGLAELTRYVLTALIVRWVLTLHRNEFMKLPVADQCKILHYLGYIPCAASGTLTTDIGENGRIESMSCSDCDSGYPIPNNRSLQTGEVENEIFNTLQTLLKSHDFQLTVEPRVRTMLAIRKLVAHSRCPDNLDLAASSCGKWCLQSHCSTLRELRIAAGYWPPGGLNSLNPVDC